VGGIKKRRHFAEKTLGGVTRRQPNFCRKSEKFFSGIVLQRNTNLFWKLLLGGLWCPLVSASGLTTTNSGGQKGRGFRGGNFCPPAWTEQAGRAAIK